MVDYNAYLKSPEWDEKRREAIQQAGGRCARCGRTDLPLEVHHLHYETLGDEGPEDLEALCKDCHPRADAEREQLAEEHRQERDAEFWEGRLDHWASKVYGDDWQKMCSERGVELRFIDWLDEMGEGDTVPEDKRRKFAEYYFPQPSIPKEMIGTTVEVAIQQPAPLRGVSLSAIRDYQSCPWKCLKSNLESPQVEPPIRPMAVEFGKFFRRLASEHFDAVKAANRPISRADVLDGSAVLAKYREHFLIGEELRAEFRLATRQYEHDFRVLLDNFVKELNELVASRLAGRSVVLTDQIVAVTHGDVEFRTSFDLALVDPEGRYTVCTWKTGKKPRTDSDEEERQLLVWHWAKHRFNTPAVIVVYAFLAGRDYWIEPTCTDFYVNNLLSDLAKVATQMKQATSFPAKVNKFCEWCQWLPMCPAKLLSRY